MPDYKVSEQPRHKKDFEGKKGGVFSVWELALDGVGTVELVKKQGNAPPAQGDAVQGTVEVTEYGKKLKLDQQGFGGGGGGRSPEEKARIERMAHHKTAAELLRVAYEVGLLDGDNRPGDAPSLMATHRWLSDQLAADLPGSRS